MALEMFYLPSNNLRFFIECNQDLHCYIYSMIFGKFYKVIIYCEEIAPSFCTLFGQENRVSVIGTGTCEDVTKIGSGWNITSAKISPTDALFGPF